MARQWFRGLNAATRERYPALLSYAVMLTPDLDEARRLTDAAIVSVMGSLRPPRTDVLREAAIREAIAHAYAGAHRADARASLVSSVAARTSSASIASAENAYGPPADAAFTPPPPGTAARGETTPAGDAPAATAPRRNASHSTTPGAASGATTRGIGIAQSTSPLASALAHLSPAERVAATSWWIDGLSADQVADRLATTHNSAVDMLHRAGIALAAATSGTAPGRDHYTGSGDVVSVEVTGTGGRP